jgi:hypothetical protein
MSTGTRANHRSRSKSRCFGQSKLICTKCGLPKDKCAFVPGQSRCRKCRNEQDRSRNAAMADKQLLAMGAQVLESLIDPADIRNAFACVIAARFGGIEGFVDKWLGQHEKLRATDKRGRHARTIMRTFEYCLVLFNRVHEDNRKRMEDGPDVVTMTNEELDDYIVEIVVAQMAKDLGVLHRVCDAFGFKLTLKDEDKDDGDFEYGFMVA